MPEMLLLSNSTNHAQGYLEHAWPEVEDFMGGVGEIVFIPFAGGDHEAYTATVARAFAARGMKVRGLPADETAQEVLASAGAVFTGGGNTFRLLATLQRLRLTGRLREAVGSGALRYMGASAGINITAPTLKTTNDMPIVEPESFEALGLLPFQINPHYVDADPASTHNGETRETRLREFLEENDSRVLGLREGTRLRVQGEPETLRLTVGGTAVQPQAPGPAILFSRGAEPQEVSGEVTDVLMT